MSESELERRRLLVDRALGGDETAPKTPVGSAERRIAALVARTLAAEASPAPAPLEPSGGLDPRPARNMVSVGALASALVAPAEAHERDRDRRIAASAARERTEDREREARARRIKRRELAAERWVRKGVDWSQSAGVEHKPPDVAYSTYRMMQEIQATGERARYWLRRWAQKPKYAPILADIKNAALEPLLDGRGYRYDLSDGIARRTLAIALGALAEAMSTKHPKERYQFFVRGLSVSRLCGLLHAPGNKDRKPHRNSIGGAGRKSDEARARAAAARWAGHTRKTPPRPRWRTPLMRLRDSGFLFAWQPPKDAAAPCELATVTEKRGKRVHVRNRYLLAPKFVLGDAAARHVAGENWAREKLRTPLRYDHDGEAAPP